ncbi:MAG: DUF2256 domain-containing protein [Candidatus Nanopelagicales bacterium]
MPDRRPPRGSRAGAAPTKVCAGCGRTITWRTAWARSWDEVRWCSDACRRRGLRAADHDAEAALERALRAAPAGRAVELSAVPAYAEADRERWRSAARRLAARGEAEILVGGRVVDPSHARGPLSLRRPR